jgi:cytochrome c oxidase subunit 3
MSNNTSRSLALRTHPLVFGVLLFLVSDLMIFGGLIATYFTLRAQATAWPPVDVRIDTNEGLIGTAVLALSSLTMIFTTYYLARNAFITARFWLGTTMLLGSAFVLLTLHGWSEQSFTIASHAYGSVYYVLTGFHVLHVSIGVLLLLILFGNMQKAAFERDERAGAEAVSFFWHFVFIIWLLVWGSIYVLR